MTNAKERAVTANTVEGWMAKGPNAKEAGGDGAAAGDDDEDASSRLRLDMRATQRRRQGKAQQGAGCAWGR